MENTDAGIILELIECNGLTRPYFEGIEKMVKSADKKQLVHEFELADITPKVAVFFQLTKFAIKKLFGQVKPSRRTAEAA
jgi:hypothetical protein